MALKPAPIDVKLGVFKIRDRGGQLRTITCALSGVTLNMEAEEVEFETMCQIEKVSGNVSATIDFSGRADLASNAIDEVMYDLLGGEATEWQWFPAGEDTGNVKYHGSGVVNAYSPAADVPGIVQVSGSILINGKPSRTGT